MQHVVQIFLNHFYCPRVTPALIKQRADFTASDTDVILTKSENQLKCNICEVKLLKISVIVVKKQSHLHVIGL